MTQQLLAQRIQTPDGTILQSFNRHDYKSHVDAITNETYMVDGGLDYCRGIVNVVPATDLCVYTGDDFNHIRSAFCWGTRGVNGGEPLKYVLLKDLDADHIQAILDTQFQIPQYIRDQFVTELVFRGVDMEDYLVD